MTPDEIIQKRKELNKKRILAEFSLLIHDLTHNDPDKELFYLLEPELRMIADYLGLNDD